MSRLITLRPNQSLGCALTTITPGERLRFTGSLGCLGYRFNPESIADISVQGLVGTVWFTPASVGGEFLVRRGKQIIYARTSDPIQWRIIGRRAASTRVEPADIAIGEGLLRGMLYLRMGREPTNEELDGEFIQRYAEDCLRHKTIYPRYELPAALDRTYM